MKTKKWFAVLIAVLLGLSALSYQMLYRGGQVEQAKTEVKPVTAVNDVQMLARQVVEAFMAKDGENLSRWIHPAKGVRFSPYAFVDIEQDKIFTSQEIARFWQDPKIYTWGFADGSGDPISMTPTQYSARYIVNRDFLNPSSISIDNDQAKGNTENNAATVYPAGKRVEFYLQATQPDAMDWAALRLIFEKMGENWYLVAVIHDEWTI